LREEQQQPSEGIVFPENNFDYTANISNGKAREFYSSCGVNSMDDAFEKAAPAGVPIMYCKHCLRYSMGWCSKEGKKIPYKEPLFLALGDGRRFRLSFDCRKCMMMVLNDNIE
jgi:putative protease